MARLRVWLLCARAAGNVCIASAHALPHYRYCKDYVRVYHETRPVIGGCNGVTTITSTSSGRGNLKNQSGWPNE